MQKSKEYVTENIPVEIVREVFDTFKEKICSGKIECRSLTVEINDETWAYDSIKDFFENIPKADHLIFDVHAKDFSTGFRISGRTEHLECSVYHDQRDKIVSIFNILDKIKSPPPETHSKKNRPLSKNKTYYSTNFPVELIKNAYNEFINRLNPSLEIDFPLVLDLNLSDEHWSFNSLDEFFLLLPNSIKFRLDLYTQNKRLILSGDKKSLEVSLDLNSRDEIESIFKIFDNERERYKIEISSAPIKIFIGHGHDSQWRDLKDHLHELHGFNVTAYEIGPRAGLSVKEVLEEMLDKSSFALLVLTGEDLHTDGGFHARENVIHEVGLFQGRLNFRRAIILLEEGVQEFSNILGINQIRFSKGNIKETFGDILATIKREFDTE